MLLHKGGEKKSIVNLSSGTYIYIYKNIWILYILLNMTTAKVNTHNTLITFLVLYYNKNSVLNF